MAQVLVHRVQRIPLAGTILSCAVQCLGASCPLYRHRPLHTKGGLLPPLAPPHSQGSRSRRPQQ
eukprot:11879122-Prorocentrum_lima.AAC.1